MNGGDWGPQTVIKSQSWDIHEKYSSTASGILGVAQLLCGLTSVALGVGAICTWASAYFIGYGIWCGFIFLLSGCVCIASACHKTSCVITTNMVLAILSICCASVQLAIGVVAAENDANYNRGGVNSGKDVRYYNNFYDIFYKMNGDTSDMGMCSGGSSRFGWNSAWGPVDILLIIFGFIEGLLAVITAVLCCRAVCCGVSTVSHVEDSYNGYTGTGTTGFTNDAYLTDPRMSPAPPLYKVG